MRFGYDDFPQISHKFDNNVLAEGETDVQVLYHIWTITHELHFLNVKPVCGTT